MGNNNDGERRPSDEIKLLTDISRMVAANNNILHGLRAQQNESGTYVEVSADSWQPVNQHMTVREYELRVLSDYPDTNLEEAMISAIGAITMQSGHVISNSDNSMIAFRGGEVVYWLTVMAKAMGMSLEDMLVSYLDNGGDNV